MKNTTEGKDIATMKNTDTMKGENTMEETNTIISLFATIKFDGAISFKPCMRSNERVLIYDIRCALINEDYKTLLSLVKAWHVMTSHLDVKECGKAIDGETIRIARELIKVAYTGKKASVKERANGEHATIDVLNTSRIKAWLYTISRQSIDYVAVAGERPDEKTSQREAAVKPTISLSGAAYTMQDIQRMIDNGELIVSIK